MCGNWKTINIEQNVRKKSTFIKLKMAALQQFFTFITSMFNNWKMYQIARRLLLNKRSGFRKGNVLKNFNSLKLKKAEKGNYQHRNV